MSDINKEKRKAFSTFRKQLDEQEYRPVNEGAVKAAMEDWMESLPKEVVDEINRKYAAKLALANLTGTGLSKGDPVRKALIQLLDKYKVKPALGDPSRENDISALVMMFNGFFGESAEVSEENFNYGAYGYRIDKDGPNKFILYSLSYNQGSIRFPDGRKGTEIGTFRTKEEAIEKAKLRAEKTHPSARKSSTASVDEDWKSLKKTKADLDAIRKSGKRVSVQHGEGDTLYRVSKPKKSVKEEVEVSEEELTKVGYALVVDNKIVYRGNKKQCLKKAKEYGGLKFGKVFLTQTPKNIGQSWQKEEVNEAEQIDEASDKQKKNKLAHSNEGVKEDTIDEAGLMKLTRLGKAYDRARIGSRGLSNPENKKRLGDAYFSMRDKWLKKREDRIKSGNYSSLGKHTSVLAAAARAKRERKNSVEETAVGEETKKPWLSHMMREVVREAQGTHYALLGKQAVSYDAATEYALWGTPKGETNPFHAKVLLTGRVTNRTSADMEKAKKEAARNGWHDFRVQYFTPGVGAGGSNTKDWAKKKYKAVGEETKKPWLRWSDKMAKVTLNPKTKIGYEIRDVGPGGKSTVVKRENWPKKKNKVKEDTEQVDEVLGDFNQHTLNIARKTVKMNDVFANIMGGMNKTQAHEFLLQHGTSAEKKASKKWLDEYDKVIKTLGGKPRE